jgi:hypothetical protein
MFTPILPTPMKFEQKRTIIPRPSSEISYKTDYLDTYLCSHVDIEARLNSLVKEVTRSNGNFQSTNYMLTGHWNRLFFKMNHSPVSRCLQARTWYRADTDPNWVPYNHNVPGQFVIYDNEGIVEFKWKVKNTNHRKFPRFMLEIFYGRNEDKLYSTNDFELRSLAQNNRMLNNSNLFSGNLLIQTLPLAYPIAPPRYKEIAKCKKIKRRREPVEESVHKKCEDVIDTDLDNLPEEEEGSIGRIDNGDHPIYLDPDADLDNLPDEEDDVKIIKTPSKNKKKKKKIELDNRSIDDLISEFDDTFLACLSPKKLLDECDSGSLFSQTFYDPNRITSENTSITSNSSRTEFSIIPIINSKVEMEFLQDFDRMDDNLKLIDGPYDPTKNEEYFKNEPFSKSSQFQEFGSEYLTKLSSECTLFDEFLFRFN